LKTHNTYQRKFAILLGQHKTELKSCASKYRSLSVANLIEIHFVGSKVKIWINSTSRPPLYASDSRIREGGIAAVPVTQQLDKLGVNYVLCGITQFTHRTQRMAAQPTVASSTHTSGNNTHVVTISACPLTPMEKSDSSKSMGWFCPSLTKPLAVSCSNSRYLLSYLKMKVNTCSVTVGYFFWIFNKRTCYLIWYEQYDGENLNFIIFGFL